MGRCIVLMSDYQRTLEHKSLLLWLYYSITRHKSVWEYRSQSNQGKWQ